MSKKKNITNNISLTRALLLIFMLISASQVDSISQVKIKNPVLKWTSWALLQLIPSVTFFDDKNENNSGLKFGLEWQIIPFSYAFNTNKYVSKTSFFYINPTKRFAGSVEAFFEPDYVTGNFKYSNLKKFMFKTGGRFVVPAGQRGEYLAFSIGAGYYNQKTTDNNTVDGITYEAAVYSFFGMLGLKFNYNQNGNSRYNIGLYLKYYLTIT